MNRYFGRAATAIYLLVLVIPFIFYRETFVGRIAGVLLLLAFLTVVVGALVNFIRGLTGRRGSRS